jgi:hypothetical protein
LLALTAGSVVTRDALTHIANRCVKDLAATNWIKKDAQFNRETAATLIARGDIDAAIDDRSVTRSRKARHAAIMLRREFSGNDGLRERFAEKLIAAVAKERKRCVIHLHDRARCINRKDSVGKCRND